MSSKTTSLSNWGDPSKLGQVKVPELAKRPDYQGDLAYFRMTKFDDIAIAILPIIEGGEIVADGLEISQGNPRIMHAP